MNRYVLIGNGTAITGCTKGIDTSLLVYPEEKTEQIFGR